MSPDELALQIANLTGATGDPHIVGVNIAVPAARTHLVLGPIHSGKSMLLRHIVGLERAVEGTVTVAGETFDARGEPANVLRRMRTRVGVVFEGSALVNRIGVIENVELPLLEHTDATAREARDAARELLAEVGLAVDDDTMPSQLSRADQRRVALARALALRPPIVLLDEPTLGLDAFSAAELDDTIARAQADYGFGILIFSHEVRHAYGRTQHIYVMANGQVVASGSRDTLRDDEHEMVRKLLNRREHT